MRLRIMKSYIGMNLLGIQNSSELGVRGGYLGMDLDGVWGNS